MGKNTAHPAVRRVLRQAIRIGATYKEENVTHHGQSVITWTVTWPNGDIKTYGGARRELTVRAVQHDLMKYRKHAHDTTMKNHQFPIRPPEAS